MPNLWISCIISTFPHLSGMVEPASMAMVVVVVVVIHSLLLSILMAHKRINPINWTHTFAHWRMSYVLLFHIYMYTYKWNFMAFPVSPLEHHPFDFFSVIRRNPDVWCVFNTKKEKNMFSGRITIKSVYYTKAQSIR